MAVKKDERFVKSKKDKNKMVKKITYKCEGSYVDCNGELHRYHKRGFAGKEEAKEWERSFLLSAKNEVSSNITFGELYAIFISSKQGILKERSIYDYTKVSDLHILPYWKDIHLEKISKKTIELYQKSLLTQKSKHGGLLANRTIEAIQTKFKGILKYGFDMGYIKDYRITNFKIAQRKNEIKKEMHFWHPDEYNSFIKQVQLEEKSVIYVAFYSVLYWCGTRLGETLALKWSDVNMQEKSIQISKTYSKQTKLITTPKTRNSYRTILMPDTCYKAMLILYQYEKDIIGFSEDSFVFLMDKPLDNNNIKNIKDRCAEKADVPIIRIHDFRHSHVSLLINLGFDSFDIAKRLGHTVDMVNNIYGHWFNDAQIKMVDKLNSI